MKKESNLFFQQAAFAGEDLSRIASYLNKQLLCLAKKKLHSVLCVMLRVCVCLCGKRMGGGGHRKRANPSTTQAQNGRRESLEFIPARANVMTALKSSAPGGHAHIRCRACVEHFEIVHTRQVRDTGGQG